MNKSFERRRILRSIAGAVTFGIVLAVSMINVVGQIKIGGVTIGKPDVNKPTTSTGTAGTTSGKPNQPSATTSGNGGSNSSASRTETPAALVNAFKADANPYRQGILQLVSMQDDLKKDWSPICNAACIRTGLDQGAALATIIRQKYPNIENPSSANNFDDKVGDWRRLAEGREEIVKTYLNDKVGAVVRTKAKQLDKDRGNLSTLGGFALPIDFADRGKAHAEVAKEFVPMLALVGMTMPDSSVFSAYDAALDALIAEARKRAGEWGWGATFHDPAIESKARSWLLLKLDPQAQVLSMGLTDAAWQVNKNSLGIPEGRYRRGLIIYRKPGLDTCVVAKFSFEQSYVGGGQYNAMSNTSGLTYQVRLQTCK